MSQDKSPEHKLGAAYARYAELFEAGHRQGSVGAKETAKARLDLVLALIAAGEDVPPLVEVQLRRDATTLLQATEPLAQPDVRPSPT